VVRLDLTIGQDGRVTDARIARSVPMLDAAALSAARQWEFEPPVVDGRNVPVVHTVDVLFDLPEPHRVPSALPGATAERPSAPPPSKPPDPAAPARDPRAEAVKAVRDVLGRYEAAWEDLNYDAVTGVHALTPEDARRLRANLGDLASYQIDISVKEIVVDPDARGATVTSTVTRRYRPRAGSPDGNTVTQTFRLEKRGDHWMIVGLR
jgi:TonB family protein